MATEILHCEFDGHRWERERSRGQKPHFCPAHKKTKDTGQDNSELAATAGTEAHTYARVDALDLLTCGIWLDDEFRRKLEFVVDVLDDPRYLGRREDGDVSMLRETQDRLMRECERRWPRSWSEFRALAQAA